MTWRIPALVAVVALVIRRFGVVGAIFPLMIMALLAAHVLVTAVVVVRARMVIVFEIIVIAEPVRMFDLHFGLNSVLYFL